MRTLQQLLKGKRVAADIDIETIFGHIPVSGVSGVTDPTTPWASAPRVAELAMINANMSVMARVRHRLHRGHALSRISQLPALQPCEEPPATPSPLGMDQMLSPGYR